MSSNPTPILVCPECQGSMRSRDRDGITIDGSEYCGGVILDRDELERFVDAEVLAGEARNRDEIPHGSGQSGDHSDSKQDAKDGARRRRGFLRQLLDSAAT